MLSKFQTSSWFCWLQKCISYLEVSGQRKTRAQGFGKHFTLRYASWYMVIQCTLQYSAIFDIVHWKCKEKRSEIWTVVLSVQSKCITSHYIDNSADKIKSKQFISKLPFRFIFRLANYQTLTEHYNIINKNAAEMHYRPFRGHTETEFVVHILLKTWFYSFNF